MKKIFVNLLLLGVFSSVNVFAEDVVEEYKEYYNRKENKKTGEPLIIKRYYKTINGKKIGYERMYFKDGKIQSETFYDEKGRQGLSFRITDGTNNPKLIKSYYKNNKLEKEETFNKYNEKKEKEVNYSNGLLHGDTIVYDPDGSIRTKKVYINNVEDRSQLYIKK